MTMVGIVVGFQGISGPDVGGGVMGMERIYSGLGMVGVLVLDGGLRVILASTSAVDSTTVSVDEAGFIVISAVVAMGVDNSGSDSTILFIIITTSSSAPPGAGK